MTGNDMKYCQPEFMHDWEYLENMDEEQIGLICEKCGKICLDEAEET